MNLSRNYTTFIFNQSESFAYKGITITIILVGLTLNVTSVILYCKKRKFENHFDYCLNHLALANVVQYIGVTPYVLIRAGDIPYELTEVENHIYCSLLDGVSVFFIAAVTSAYLLCFLALTRYKIIKQPLTRYKFTNERTRRFVLFSWILSTFLLIPNFFTLKMFENDPFCWRTHPFGELFFVLYSLVTSLVGFYGPLIFMSVTCILTVRHLFSERGETCQIRIKHRSQVITILCLLITNFVACWLPFCVVLVLSASGIFGKTIPGEIVKLRWFKLSISISLLAGILNIVCNCGVQLYRRCRKMKVYFKETQVMELTDL